MMRKSTCFWIGASLCIGMTLVMTTQKVTDARQKLHMLTAQIQSEEESLRVLQAEWSYLNQPDRLEKLSQQYLSLTPMRAKQFARLNEFPAKEKEGTTDPVLSVATTKPSQKMESLTLPDQIPDQTLDTDTSDILPSVNPIASNIFTPSSLRPHKKPPTRKVIPKKASEEKTITDVIKKMAQSAPVIKPSPPTPTETRNMGDVLHSLGVN